MHSAIDMHLASPDVSLDEHVRRRQIELAISLESKRAIFLDVKYWIVLREIATAVRTASCEIEFLRLLRTLAADGKVFCPISDGTFAELFKQRDQQKRMTTAQLIDELSLGIALIPFERRVATELAHFIYARTNPHGVHPLHHLVWCNLSYALGELHPTQTGFDAKTELALQKAFFDHLGDVPLVDMFDRLGDATLPGETKFERLAAQLNAGNAQHAVELRSFAQTYANEIGGSIDLFANTVLDIVGEMFRKETGLSPDMDDGQRLDHERQWRNLLITAFKKDATKDALRTLHINACLHASVRWNKRRQLEANDFYDFRHASAALGYCAAFLTERSLLSMVTARNVALDKRYGCCVISEIPEALEYLRSVK